MTKLFLSVALAIAGIAAAILAIKHYPAVQIVVQRAVSPGELSAKHAYLADRCASCHDPNHGVAVAKCTACHANSERLLGRQPTMFHASIGECSTCHLEHQRIGPRPLKMDHVELARVGARTLEQVSNTDADSAATLTFLKTWLGVKRPSQFEESSAREVLNCAACHDRKDPHFKRFGTDCAQPHLRNMAGARVSTSIFQIQRMRAVSSGAAESLHGAFFDDLPEVRSQSDCARGPVFRVPQYDELERHRRCWILQASLKQTSAAA